MEPKKSREANLENKKAGFFFVGLTMVSALVGMAFHHQTVVPDEVTAKIEDNSMNDDLIFEIPPEEEIIEEQPEVAPPPPVIEEIEVTEEEVEEEFDMSQIADPILEIPEEVVEAPKAEEILDFAAVEPEFPGGQAEMAKWIQKEVKYPELSKEMGEQGVVYVKFVVNSNGTIEQVQIARGVSDALDAEAKRVVKNMPKWKPGEQAGKKVRVRYTLPIQFRLG